MKSDSSSYAPFALKKNLVDPSLANIVVERIIKSLFEIIELCENTFFTVNWLCHCAISFTSFRCLLLMHLVTFSAYQYIFFLIILWMSHDLHTNEKMVRRIILVIVHDCSRRWHFWIKFWSFLNHFTNKIWMNQFISKMFFTTRFQINGVFDTYLTKDSSAINELSFWRMLFNPPRWWLSWYSYAPWRACKLRKCYFEWRKLRIQACE